MCDCRFLSTPGAFLIARLTCPGTFFTLARALESIVDFFSGVSCGVSSFLGVSLLFSSLCACFIFTLTKFLFWVELFLCFIFTLTEFLFCPEWPCFVSILTEFLFWPELLVFVFTLTKLLFRDLFSTLIWPPGIVFSNFSPPFTWYFWVLIFCKCISHRALVTVTDTIEFIYTFSKAWPSLTPDWARNCATCSADAPSHRALVACLKQREGEFYTDSVLGNCTHWLCAPRLARKRSITQSEDENLIASRFSILTDTTRKFVAPHLEGHQRLDMYVGALIPVVLSHFFTFLAWFRFERFLVAIDKRYMKRSLVSLKFTILLFMCSLFLIFVYEKGPAWISQVLSLILFISFATETNF